LRPMSVSGHDFSRAEPVMKFLRNALASPQNLKTSFANRGHFGVRWLAAAFLASVSGHDFSRAESVLATRHSPPPLAVIPNPVAVFVNGGEGSAFSLTLCSPLVTRFPRPRDEC
jgi:hypothetical protein